MDVTGQHAIRKGAKYIPSHRLHRAVVGLCARITRHSHRDTSSRLNFKRARLICHRVVALILISARRDSIGSYRLTLCSRHRIDDKILVFTRNKPCHRSRKLIRIRISVIFPCIVGFHRHRLAVDGQVAFRIHNLVVVRAVSDGRCTRDNIVGVGALVRPVAAQRDAR